MGNLGGGEILVILLVALIVLGPTKLPPAVRQVGKFVGEIRRIGQGFQQELREAAQPLQEATADLKAADKSLRETTQKPLKEMTDTLKAADPRKVIEPPPAAKDVAKGKAKDTAASGNDGVASGPVSWGTAAASVSTPPPATSEQAGTAASGDGGPDTGSGSGAEGQTSGDATASGDGTDAKGQTSNGGSGAEGQTGAGGPEAGGGPEIAEPDTEKRADTAD